MNKKLLQTIQIYNKLANSDKFTTSSQTEDKSIPPTHTKKNTERESTILPLKMILIDFRVYWIYAIGLFTDWKNAITKTQLGNMPL